MISSVATNSSAINYISIPTSSKLSAEEVPDIKYSKEADNKSNEAEVAIFAAKNTSDDSNANVTVAKKTAATSYKSEKAKNQNVLLGNYGNNLNEDNLTFGNNESSASITSSFYELAAAVGASGSKVTKEQLISYLHSITSSSSGSSTSAAEITFIKNLIAKFDTISNGADYITSFNGVNDIQDYKTITKEQVTLPIDVRV